MRSLEAKWKCDDKKGDMYLEHCEELFEVFKAPVIASQELAPPVWIEQVDSMQPLAFER